MTVEYIKTKEIYEGNGATRVFPVPFQYSTNIAERTETLNFIFTDAQGHEHPIADNYEIHVNTSGDTSVTYPLEGNPIPSGTKFTVYRKTPLHQIVDLIYGGSFNPDVLENDGLDRVVMMVQEVKEELDRAVKVSISYEGQPKTAEEYLAEVGAQVAQAESAATAAANSAGDAAGYAESAAESADAAAQSAADAAGFVPDALIARVEAVETKTQPATEVIRGIVRLATSAEASAGTNDNAAMTPLKTKTVLDILAAKKVNYTDFTQLLGYNPGWVKLPNGMLLQWGKTASANAANTIVTFSIAFPNVCLHCVGIGRAAGAGEQGYATVNFTTQSQAVFNCFKAMSGLAPSLAAQGAVDVWWLAIGY